MWNSFVFVCCRTAKIWKNKHYTFKHLWSNAINLIFLLHDHDLHFRFQMFKICEIRFLMFCRIAAVLSTSTVAELFTSVAAVLSTLTAAASCTLASNLIYPQIQCNTISADCQLRLEVLNICYINKKTRCYRHHERPPRQSDCANSLTRDMAQELWLRYDKAS